MKPSGTGEADEAMNSLLTEIDNEMSYIAEDETVQETWKIPLQEIGDETMEMIISHNTQNNINFKDAVDESSSDIEPINTEKDTKTSLSPIRKSVVFSEGVSLYECQSNKDKTDNESDVSENHDENDSSDRDVNRSGTAETSWKQSKFVVDTKENVENSAMFTLNESDNEIDHEQDVAISKEEFLAHTVTEKDQKLAHILDSKVNVHRLKQMADEVNLKANASDNEDGGNGNLKFTLPPTEPLISDEPMTIEEASLIHFEASDSEDADDASLEEDCGENYINEIVHSPSKIPLANTMNINNFKLDQPSNDPQTRVSSGSSWGDSVADLATIKNDRYNLLEYSSEIPKELQFKEHEQKESFKNVAINANRNISQVFSIATTADGYKSAQEIPSATSSIEFETHPPSLSNLQSAFQSVEDLGICQGLTRDEETLKDLHYQIKDAKGLSSSNFTDEQSKKDHEEQEVPNLPHLPSSHVSCGIAADAEKSGASKLQNSKNSSVSLYSDQVDLEFTDLHDISSQSLEEPFSSIRVASHGYMERLSQPDKSNGIPEDKKNIGLKAGLRDAGNGENDSQENTNLNASKDVENTTVSDESDSQEDTDLNDSNDVKSATESDVYIKKTASLVIGENNDDTPINHVENMTDKSNSIDYNGREALKQILPPVQRLGSIFMEDPFGDEFDTSGDSLDLTKSAKPSNYLSIWHMQEEDIKSYSPTFSSNSQFTECSIGTGTSTGVTSGETDIGIVSIEQKAGSRAFKFKPRVISRSKYYYPEHRSEHAYNEDEYIVSTFENALDPLRRNTIISKRIQENIRQRRSLYPKIDIAEEAKEEDEQGCLNIEKVRNPIDSTMTQNVKDVDCQKEAPSQLLLDESQRHDEKLNCTSEDLELIPCEVDNELGKDFVSLFELFDHDNKSILTLNDVQKGSLNIWKEEDDSEWVIGNIQKKKASFEAINKLLENENQVIEEVASTNPATPRKSTAVFKNPVRDVSVGRCSSVRGYEADITQDNDSEQISVNHNGSCLIPQDEYTTGGVIRSTHVGSPFKIIKTKKSNIQTEEHASLSENDLFSAEKDEKFETNEVESPIKAPLNSIENNPFKDLASEASVDNEPLPDRGTIYIKLGGIINLSLHDLRHHDAKFSIEFDNGENVVRTPWTAASNEKSMNLQKEFEVVLSSVAELPTFIITLKCRYQRPESELAEVVEKIPVPKKFIFGKSKYEYKRKYVQRGLKYDEWDYMFAQDGSFGRCEIKLNDDNLKNVRFHKKSMELNLINEWARQPDLNNLKKPLYELPRKAPSVVAKLQVEMCYLERSFSMEKFPKTLDIAHSIVEKYKLQQTIAKEGFLLQEGGDIQGIMQRRYFKLQGCNLIGYHEISRVPKVDINLLKVLNVYGPGDVPKEGERNLTDLVLLGGYIHLIFDNDEEISFNADTKENADSWYQAFRDVVDLNKCHQPWVKQLYDNSMLNEL